MSANFKTKSINAAVDTETYFWEPKGIEFGVGWQFILTGIAGGSTNGLDLTYTVYGSHVVDGVKQWVPLHTDTLTSASVVTPGGTVAGYVSALVQDPWAKYESLAFGVTVTAAWDLNLSVKTPGPSFS